MEEHEPLMRNSKAPVLSVAAPPRPSLLDAAHYSASFNTDGNNHACFCLCSCSVLCLARATEICEVLVDFINTSRNVFVYSFLFAKVVPNLPISTGRFQGSLPPRFLDTLFLFNVLVDFFDPNQKMQ